MEDKDKKITPDVVQEPVELTAGEVLRNARTTGRRKREIPTIAKQLCIREEFLQALEDGNYTFIPELVYILGFARNYAMELGLNPDEIVAKIKREMGIVSDCGVADMDSCDVSNRAGRVERKSVDFVALVKKYWTFVVKYWYWFVGGLAVLLLLGGVIFFIARGSDTSTDAETDVVVVTQADNEPAFRMAVRERWGADNAKDANIILQAARGSWIKIEDGRGRTEFSRVLVEGDIYYVPASGKYKATFGDAGGIDVWVNGKLAPKVGADHVRKSGIALDADTLMAANKTDKKSEKTTDDAQDDNSKSDSADSTD